MSVAFAALLLVLLMLPVPASAQHAELQLRVNDTVLEPDGTTTIEFTLAGEAAPAELDASQLVVSEAGEPIGDIEVVDLDRASDDDPTTVMIVFDVSGSTRGEPLAAAQAAAIELVETIMPDGVEVGLLPFSNGITLAVEPTSDQDAVVTGIQALEVGGSTRLYDALIEGSDALADAPGDRILVLFSDGGDTTSESELPDALAAASAIDAPIFNVALSTPEQDPEVMATLADDSDGILVEADELDELSAAFATVAQALVNRFTVTYRGTEVSPELAFELIASVDGTEASASGLLVNPRVESLVNVQPPPAANVFDAGQFGTEQALYIALGVAFLALLLFLAVLFIPRGDRQVQRTLQRGLTLAGRGGTRAAQATTGLSASAIGQRALAAITAAPKPKGYEERLQVEIDRAGWQLRASEFIAMRIGGFIGGLLLAWALTGQWWFGLVAAVAGLYAPSLGLLNAKQRRQKAFAEQLPDTLQLLAGTLKAGYGVLQGIDTIVKETQAPMSTEFQRVLTEARLGLPLEDSLEEMADRVGSDDFKWVVVAMNIQRQVGGNLADLLETVSETLRGREQTRRQIQVLSAEGKLSAYILVALPFLLLFYLLLVNPTYLTPLITNPIGLFMAGGAVLLMLAGIFWMSRMIKIDV